MDSTCRSVSSDATPHAVTRPALPAVGACPVPPTPFPPANEALLDRSVPIRSEREEHPPWHPRSARPLSLLPTLLQCRFPQLVEVFDHAVRATPRVG